MSEGRQIAVWLSVEDCELIASWLHFPGPAIQVRGGVNRLLATREKILAAVKRELAEREKRREPE